ncbi:MAG: hypothetical protein HRT41_04045 [Campylobacteraceae bacterium]|nr:hypothetical protein [Campylobacteraceae bacterium]
MNILMYEKFNTSINKEKEFKFVLECYFRAGLVDLYSYPLLNLEIKNTFNKIKAYFKEIVKNFTYPLQVVKKYFFSEVHMFLKRMVRF